ncbi:NUDIX hydrolase [Pacmanvirus A23]|uniref:MutT/NUDIX hydrolase n=1 Tax=Pacmanvirus A23 TaxID=1932881 RepID=UPI000A09440B|nr:MutT/NUDIX hydrolase [Pacmanvirus A23]SIP85915.1 NUDIX hydrolase [Pacmanvirus A23]
MLKNNHRKYNKYRAGCILITRYGKILVVHQTSSDYWGFPKGHKNPNESFIDAALRELYEESGKKVDKNIIYDRFKVSSAQLFVIIDDFDMECKVDGNEIDEYKWATMNELKDLKTSKFTKGFFYKLENTISQLILKKEIYQN